MTTATEIYIRRAQTVVRVARRAARHAFPN